MINLSDILSILSVIVLVIPNLKKNYKLQHFSSIRVDPGSATITVTAVEVPELTEEEQRDRLHLERRVERAFFEAGKALTELRDRRLYRSTHKTFEEYCRDRFAHSRQQSNY
ncbi:hypothetical protein [Nostoc favosum]|uniref:hypothetical protein n=1 Tax=Nostoc favosum TaxID=2907819 RepID=UPI001E5B5350|nr:hypothetical protein [Nostoc favosum]